MCRPRPVASRRHDIRMSVRSGDAPWSCTFTCGAAPRDSRAPPSSAGAATIPTATAASCESRPVALGLAVSRVERLANGSRHRETGDGHRVASPQRTMSKDNPLWGAPRIHGELLKLGLGHARAGAVRPVPQTWVTGLRACLTLRRTGDLWFGLGLQIPTPNRRSHAGGHAGTGMALRRRGGPTRSAIFLGLLAIL